MEPQGVQARGSILNYLDFDEMTLFDGHYG